MTARSFGKTAWWDFKPPSPGGVQISANGGFDVVVAVYTWSEETSRITRTVRCQNDEAGSEDVLIPRVSAGTNYTIQVGGANGAGGPLNLLFDYFPDTDGDGVLDDAPTSARSQPGIERFGGCPPELRSAPRISYTAVGAASADHRARDRRRAEGRPRRGALPRCGRKVTPARRAAPATLQAQRLRRAHDPHRRPASRSASRSAAPARAVPLRRDRQVLPLAGRPGRPRQAEDELPAARLAQAHEVPMRRAVALALLLAALAAAPAGAAAPGPTVVDFETARPVETQPSGRSLRRAATGGTEVQLRRAEPGGTARGTSTTSASRSTSTFPAGQATVSAFVRVAVGAAAGAATLVPRPRRGRDSVSLRRQHVGVRRLGLRSIVLRTNDGAATITAGRVLDSERSGLDVDDIGFSPTAAARRGHHRRAGGHGRVGRRDVRVRRQPGRG